MVCSFTVLAWPEIIVSDVKPESHYVHKSFPNDVNTLFAGSGKCVSCHGSDPAQQASVDNQGNDINVIDDWAPSMMANSAKDPFWRAKVSHEVLVNPGHQTQIETNCTSCHAPLGHFDAIHNGAMNYGINDMISDSIALDGVSCSACHQISPQNIGQTFSGKITYDTNHIIWGQYPNPFSAPMLSITGFDAQEGTHMSESVACASCHTLITPTSDLTGNYTGDEFIEQATYHEWLNSVYSTIGGKTCQDCHMPSTTDSVWLSSDHTFLNKRSPFSKHTFVGANAFMLELMKLNTDTLDLNATTDQFDASIEQSLDLLQDSSQNLSCVETLRTLDTAFYEVEIENLAGHKLPSGYPSRRMFVQFVVMDSVGDTLFQSGTWDNTFEVNGHDTNYEPHYDMINEPHQIQIYEMVFGDVGLNKTTILERGFQVFKDNRIPPKGFSTTHTAYDTVRIEGTAANDVNFNNASTGSGADLINYHIPLNGYTGDLNVICRTYYQTAPPAWMSEMFSHSSPEIDHFKSMFDAADRTPVLMKQVLLGDIFTGVKEPVQPTVLVYPNPSNGSFRLEGLLVEDIGTIRIFNLSGKLVQTLRPADHFNLNLPSSAYLMVIDTKDHKRLTKRIVIR